MNCNRFPWSPASHRARLYPHNVWYSRGAKVSFLTHLGYVDRAGAEAAKLTEKVRPNREIVMNASEVDKTVDEFEAARERGEYFPKAWSDRLSIDDAYRVQLGLIRRRSTQTGRGRIGWKGGLTARGIYAH